MGQSKSEFTRLLLKGGEEPVTVDFGGAKQVLITIARTSTASLVISDSMANCTNAGNQTFTLDPSGDVTSVPQILSVKSDDEYIYMRAASADAAEACIVSLWIVRGCP